MEHRAIVLDVAALPVGIQPFVMGAKCYDYSGAWAQTVFCDKEDGYFLKTAPTGALAEEALLAKCFHAKGLSPAVCAYVSAESDFLVTARLAGENGITQKFLDQPKRLCDVFAESLRRVHQTDFADCPISDRITPLVDEALPTLKDGSADQWLMSYVDMKSEDTAIAYATLQEGRHLLQNDALLHGDGCLPNILLTENMTLSGWVDVGGGGVGDRHYDLLWGIWSLGFNLGTEAYRERFLDVYGREYVDEERLRLCGTFATQQRTKIKQYYSKAI